VRAGRKMHARSRTSDARETGPGSGSSSRHGRGGRTGAGAIASSRKVVISALLTPPRSPGWPPRRPPRAPHVLFPEGPPDLLGRDRHLGDPDAARVVKGVRDGGRRRDHRVLADAARSHRAVRLRRLDEVDRHLGRHVLRRRDLVVHERGVHRTPRLRVEDELLHRPGAESLDDAAVRLPSDETGIHDASDVVAGRDPLHRHLPVSGRPRSRPPAPKRPLRHRLGALARLGVEEEEPLGKVRRVEATGPPMA